MPPILSSSDILAVHFNPEGMCRVYEISIHFNNASGSQTLKFSQEIKCLERLTDGGYIFEIKRDQAILDEHKAADNPGVALAEDCGSVLYPMQLTVNSSGKVTSLHNYNAIRTRWQDIEPKLSAYYTGPVAEAYIRQSGDTIGDPEKIKEIIRQDLFLNIFFAPLYEKYTAYQSMRRLVPYPVLAFYQPVLFEVSQQARQKDGENIHIEQDGSITEVQKCASLHDPEQYVEINSGTIKAKYLLSPPPLYYIETAECRWEAAHHEVTGITIKLNCIDDYSQPKHQ